MAQALVGREASSPHSQVGSTEESKGITGREEEVRDKSHTTIDLIRIDSSRDYRF